MDEHGNEQGSRKAKQGKASRGEWETVVPKKGIPQHLHRTDMPPREQWAPSIVLWEPIYLEGFGNSCTVSMEDGRQAYFGIGTMRILRDIAEHYAIDIDRMRDKYRDFVVKSQWPPVVVASRGLVFFAIKTRCPNHKNDGATGYIADTAIRHVESLTTNTTRIHLHQGIHIDVLESRRCVMARRNNATSFKGQLANDGIIPRT